MEFRRKNIRLPRSCYIGRQWYFWTACTERRVPRFSDGGLVAEQIEFLDQVAQQEGAEIQAYCFMPDHLHILVSGTQENSDSLRFMNAFKQRSAHAFQQRTRQRLWQHRAYDHILRRDERWEAVAAYIWMNPVRKGLCNRAEEWPFSGSQTVDWRALVAVPREPWTPPWK